MLIRTLRTFLQPYKRLLTAVVILSLIGTMAALYLPSLNASIIDEGVAKGDTGFIWHTGGIMLAVSAHPGARLDDRGLLRRQGGDGLRPRRPRRDLPPGDGASRRASSTGSARRR